MSWNSYGLDRVAQELVLNARQRDETVDKKYRSLNQAHKMRMAVAYGLERFWGEPLRLQHKEKVKSQFWAETWQEFVKIMAQAGIEIPADKVSVDDVQAIKTMSEKLWKLDIETQRLALAVLTQLCDAIVWWTQRYRTGGSDDA
jgi:hypothetical protein